MINVTKTYLPSFDKYTNVLKRAWDKAWITNNGELVQELELRLKEYLGVKHLYFCTNGTVVLQMALKALNITKEVITTPFSYVATSNSILWEGGTPIFVDIEPRTFCIDPDKIEAAITEKTEAILATHVYGFPCDMKRIEQIARKYGIKVIYDGAHAFGSKYDQRSLLSYGDISTCSFHATKIFHSVEGGCVITNNDEVAQKLMLYRQFGHVYDDYQSVGINAKNSEFHAAMGLCVLDDFEAVLDQRKQITGSYRKKLNGYSLYMPFVSDEAFEGNNSYFPVVFESEGVLLRVVDALKEKSIFPRRYFYPSLNTLPFAVGNTCSISEDISRRVLCLPSFHDLGEEQIIAITDIVKNVVC